MIKIYTPSGSIPFKAFEFPDWQPHIKLQARPEPGDWPSATIEARIQFPEDLLQVLLIKDALSGSGFNIINLDIRYLMGARMDRAIDASQPFTLQVIARILRGAGFSKIRVLDPHSGASLSLLNAEGIWPTAIVKSILKQRDPASTVIICPDEGSKNRFIHYREAISGFRAVQGLKKRDPATGNLSGFGIEDASSVEGKGCLIIDDICDGGGTFSGLATVLAAVGASYIDLFVTHGLFTKGLPLTNIRHVYTTDSIMAKSGLSGYRDAIIYPIEMGR